MLVFCISHCVNSVTPHVTGLLYNFIIVPIFQNCSYLLVFMYIIYLLCQSMYFPRLLKRQSVQNKLPIVVQALGDKFFQVQNIAIEKAFVNFGKSCDHVLSEDRIEIRKLTVNNHVSKNFFVYHDSSNCFLLFICFYA